ncbi:MAG: 16S rRNA processing protein RimM [Endozoicomonadaceae bacterium]|nr:16S rRNA processing protein RimM [Endozoicomonadaceae bacterium]MBE8233112.1 16S rRNA processing protein RimM [Endozoicomonadaceae bacterium]
MNINQVMPLNDPWLKVGQVISFYGVRGWLKICDWSETTGSILNYHNWFLGETSKHFKPAPHMESRMHGQYVLVRFDHCLSRDQASVYLKQHVFIHENCLPTLSPGDYYWRQLEKMQVFYVDQQAHSVCLGIVDRILETGANDVLMISSTQESLDDRERLIPWIENKVICSVDIKAGHIIVNWDPSF